MTIFDLLFIVLFLCAVAALAAAMVLAFKGRGAQAGRIGLRLAVSAAVYVGAVYTVTAVSKPVSLKTRRSPMQRRLVSDGRPGTADAAFVDRHL